MSSVAAVPARFISRYGAPQNWFPGHMATSTHAIAKTLRSCDVVIEVRDARIPISSGNPMLTHMLTTSSRARICVFNKADLVEPAALRVAASQLRSAGISSIFTDASGHANARTHAKRIIAAIDACTTAKFATVGVTALVVGLPNVGKSSIINALAGMSTSLPRSDRASGRAKVGAEPGVTRHVSPLLVRPSPRLYVYDSPGIMLPRITDPEVALKLCLCECLPDRLVKWSALAEYLLFAFHRARRGRELVAALQLQREYGQHEVESMLDELAMRLNQRAGDGGWDHDAAARAAVRAFREGRMGRHMLDDLE